MSSQPTRKLPAELDLNNAVYNEKSHDPSSSSNSDLVMSPETPGFDKAATRKPLRKLDFHLIPFLALIYIQAICEPESVKFKY
ncbi:hypothetical protein G7Y89_g12080 [Cudoniella acicularis]|uniref:Uncharacterized protein n=1 Tax=Cudoniella acicularis TaxID=354080 RepID=A0A8H4RC29_9HELO|nr:hypothetical protein G7Y89_g12080 [Cudoniella acicularis]